MSKTRQDRPKGTAAEKRSTPSGRKKAAEGKSAKSGKKPPAVPKSAPTPAPAEKPLSPLQELAQAYGVLSAFTDALGSRQEADERALLLVLHALGAPVERAADVPDALRERRLVTWKRPLEPVSIAWTEHAVDVRLRLPAHATPGGLSAHLQLEDGGTRTWKLKLEDAPTLESADVEGTSYALKEFRLPGKLPMGYHRLRLEGPGWSEETLIVSAPEQAYAQEAGDRIWGVFLPLYALHSRGSWGAGDFADMQALYDWVGGLGGRMVATLPFLAAFLDEPFDASPYSPASRLFWNEFFLNLTAIPELERCSEARRRMEAIEARELHELRSAELVDYRRQMALKRSVLDRLARCFFSEAAPRREAFNGFVASNPAVEDYARFRAVGERLRRPWPQWPTALRQGSIGPEDYDEASLRYHLYVQWLADEQIRTLAAKARTIGPGLYLDLPLGVSPYAYDLWREHSLYPSRVSGGAPPDIVFTNGQDWGFPPLHPHKIREDGYRYVRQFLGRVMHHAGLLRIDHVPWLHRVYWIPSELEASKGAYVRYPAEELYAVLSLESHRNRCEVVGENLGTVPEAVNEAMDRHKVLKMYVVQYELEGNRPEVLPEVPENVTASLNTHDMAPFAGFLQGKDIEARREIGLLNEADVKQKRKEREETKAHLSGFLKRKGLLKDGVSEASMLRAALACLGSSPARLVLASLEDLWLETESQNLPGTSGDRPNWRRKARLSLEALQASPEVTDTLKALNRTRKEE